LPPHLVAQLEGRITANHSSFAQNDSHVTYIFDMHAEHTFLHFSRDNDLECTRRAISRLTSFVAVTGVTQIRRRQFWEVSRENLIYGKHWYSEGV